MSNFSGDSLDYALIESIVPSLVTAMDNGNLWCIPLPKEICAMIFDIELLSAPSSDFFMGIFFQLCWKIIGMNII